MATRIQLRRATAAQWTAANPVLASGEPALETDTGKSKSGDGVTAWASLPYDVAVTTHNSSEAAHTGTFVRSTPTPIISSLAPTSGVPAGGTAVTLTGSGFTGATMVRFGALLAKSLVVVSDTSITCVSPANASGASSVTVTTPAGTTSAGVTFTFTGSSAAPFRAEIGAISWDAPSPTLGREYFDRERSHTRTSFSFLEPARGWNYNGIDPAALQARVDGDILDAAAAGIGHFARVWYPTSPAIAESTIAEARTAHRASRHKTLCKQAHILFLNDAGTPVNVAGLWTSTYIPAIVAEMQDSSYATVTVAGVVRPVYYLFTSPAFASADRGWGSNAAAAAALNALRNAVQAAGMGNPYMVDLRSSGGLTATLGLDAVGSYWIPINLAAGRSPYSSVAASDATFRTNAATLHKVPAITGFYDGRARGIPDSQPGYADPPTYREIEDTTAAALTWMAANTAVAANSDPARLATFYAWNEAEEGGGSLQPTLQDGTTFTDAVRAAVVGPLPASYIAAIDSDSSKVVPTGTWTSVFPVQNLHRNGEVTSVTTNDTLTIVVYGMTGFAVRSVMGPDRGIMEIKVDGVVVANADLYLNAASPAVVYRSGVLVAGQHTIVLRCTGTKHGSSSGFKVGLDVIHATIDRATSAPPVVTYLDTYTRADSATALGVATPSGLTYTVVGGMLGISAGQAYAPAGQAAGLDIIGYLETGLADATVEAKVTPSSVVPGGLVFRVTDAANFWIVYLDVNTNSATLYKVVAGAATQVGPSFTGVYLTEAATWQAVCAGSNITVKKNGVVAIATQTDAFNSTATKAGMRFSTGIYTADGSGRFDDLRAF